MLKPTKLKNQPLLNLNQTPLKVMKRKKMEKTQSREAEEAVAVEIEVIEETGEVEKEVTSEVNVVTEKEAVEETTEAEEDQTLATREMDLMMKVSRLSKLLEIEAEAKEEEAIEGKEATEETGEEEKEEALKEVLKEAVAEEEERDHQEKDKLPMRNQQETCQALLLLSLSQPPRSER